MVTMLWASMISEYVVQFFLPFRETVQGQIEAAVMHMGRCPWTRWSLDVEGLVGLDPLPSFGEI